MSVRYRPGVVADGGIEIRFHGAGNAFADGGRSHACIQVTAPGVSLLLDCGGSSLPAIRRAGVADAIDAVAVSHLHGDHFGGIAYLVLQQHFAGRQRPLTVAGPRGLAGRLRQVEQSIYPDFFGTTRLTFDVPMLQLGASESPLGGARVSAIPVTHAPDSEPHGLRVRIGDRLIAYSGDTTWTDSLRDLARGADLFICEATNYEHDDAAHVSYRTIMRHRGDLECERIVLTHLGATTLAHLDELELEYAREDVPIRL